MNAHRTLVGLLLASLLASSGCSAGPGTGTDCSAPGADPNVCEAQFCGGIAAIPCPGAGTCVDDPGDDCDPDKGGADCGGLCKCNVQMLCVPGYVFDRSPKVCNCVPAVDPCSTIRCANGYHCEVQDNQGTCVPDVNPCAAVLCPVGSDCVVKDGEGVCVPVGGEPCGNVTCGRGLTCCNASCGICVQPGRACIQIACN